MRVRIGRVYVDGWAFVAFAMFVGPAYVSYLMVKWMMVKPIAAAFRAWSKADRRKSAARIAERERAQAIMSQNSYSGGQVWS